MRRAAGEAVSFATTMAEALVEARRLVYFWLERKVISPFLAFWSVAARLITISGSPINRADTCWANCPKVFCISNPL